MAWFTPYGGMTADNRLDEGSINDTIDENESTYMQYKDGAYTVIAEWYWDPRILTKYYILSGWMFEDTNTSIFKIWAEIEGEWVVVYDEDPIYLYHDKWTVFEWSGYVKTTGLRFGFNMEENHGFGDRRIYEVIGEDYDIPDCNNPPGTQGQTQCGDEVYGQDPTHLYECDNGNWIDHGYDSSCDTGPHDCSNPAGSEGSKRCGDSNYGQDPTHMYQCSNGNWTDLGYDSSCDTQTGCSNPSGPEGQTICGNSSYGQDQTHLYKCVNGNWVDQGYDSSCDTQTGCTNPQGAEGSTTCGLENYGQDPKHLYKCVSGAWVDQGYDSVCDSGTLTCSSITSESQCIQSGCHWYSAFPNPFGEPTCNDDPWFISYLPFIIGGAGAGILIAGLALSSRKKKKMYDYPSRPRFGQNNMRH